MRRVKLKITDRCNLDCRCCWSAAELESGGLPEAGTGDCSPEIVERAIDDAAEAGWDGIILCGGEASLVSECPAYIRRAKDRRLEVMMNTNGAGLTPGLIDELIAAGLDILMVSIYSLDRGLYRDVRGGGRDAFDRVMASAAHLSSRLRRNPGLLDVRIMAVLMKPTLGGLPDLLRFVLEGGFSALSTNYLVGAGNFPDLKLSAEDLRTFRSDVAPRLEAVIDKSDLDEAAKEAGVRAVRSFFARPNVTLENWSDGEYRPDGRADCNCRDRFLLVRPDGTSAPCWGFEFTDDPRYTETMTRANRLPAILAGRRFERFWSSSFDFCRYCPKGFQVWIPARRVPPRRPGADPPAGRGG
ncbi:MAG: radical SAM protein [Candidatus Aminicenantes bacterium]|nr:radical SAM protein [Candidatus Aminicenantes bacterium]